jgi:lysophospholipase L1-like esterase
VVPAGGNPAIIATPKMTWQERVQSNFDRSQAQHPLLIFDGDSITDGWQSRGTTIWHDRYAPLNAFDFGIAGDRIENVLWRLKHGQLEGLDPKMVVLMIGTNNINRNTPDEIVEGIKVLVAEYLKDAPHARLLLLGIFPRGALASDGSRAIIMKINSQIALLDDGQRVTFLDFGAKFLDPQGGITTDIMPDRLHPSAAGYQIWADAIQSEIDKTFPKK